jgi:hypothetical protein
MNVLRGIGLALAMTILAMSTAHAAPTPVINACVDVLGHVRLVTPFYPTCFSSEVPLTWSVTGPAGTPGVSGWEQVSTTTQCLNDGFCNAQISCPPGKRVLGGGAQVVSGGVPPGVSVVISNSLPINDSTWFAQAITIPFTTVVLIGAQVVAICAAV